MLGVVVSIYYIGTHITFQTVLLELNSGVLAVILHDGVL